MASALTAAREAPPVLVLLQESERIYGAERAMTELAGGLRRAGVRVSALVIREKRQPAAAAVEAALMAVRVPVRTVEVSGRFSARLVAAVRRELRGRDRAVLHTSGYKAGVHGFLAAALARRPMVATVHGWLDRDPRERFYARAEAAVLRRAARVIALSRRQEQFLCDLGVSDNRLACILPGIPDGGPIAREADGVFRVGVLGRLSPEKNLGLLALAASMLPPEPAVRFLVAGTGPGRGRIERLAHELGVLDRLEFSGYLAPADFFCRVDLLVCCSHRENMPQAVLEAMYAGRPVVATRVGGLPEMVADGETGVLIEDDDAPALADAMAALVRTPERAAAMGEAGRRRATTEFAFGKMIEAHAALYRSLP